VAGELEGGSVEDLVDAVTRGNVAEVKVVLVSVVSALAIYQVFLMAVGYGKLRLPFLASKPASATHRAVGDSVVVVTLIVAAMCLAYFGFDDSSGHGSDDEGWTRVHAISGILLAFVLAVKIVVVRWWHRMGRYLPALGLSVFGLFTITWLASAGAYLLGA
jgi:Family of unknown function (DUF6529)